MSCFDCGNGPCAMHCSPRPVHFTASPSDDRENGKWFVWDAYCPLPPAPVFTGAMEECGAVADALNDRNGTRP